MAQMHLRQKKVSNKNQLTNNNRTRCIITLYFQMKPRIKPANRKATWVRLFSSLWGWGNQWSLSQVAVNRLWTII